MVVTALLLTGIGTLALSSRSAVKQSERELVALTKSLTAVTRITDRPSAGISQDCSKIKAPRRKAVCDQLVALSKKQANQAYAQREELRSELRLDGIVVLLFRPDGTPIDSLGQPLSEIVVPDGLTESQVEPSALGIGTTETGRNGRVVYSISSDRLESNDNVVLVVAATRSINPLFAPTLRWFLTSALVVIAAAIALSFWLARRIVKPLRAATAATEQIAAGDLSVRVDPGTAQDETGHLALSINSMAASLERSQALDRQFLMSVSHDLRTPLTNIRGYAEAISDGAAPDPAAAAGVIERESRRLDRLVVDLLDLARLSAHSFEFRWAVDDLSEVVTDAAEGFRGELTSGNLALQVDAPPPGTLWARIDPDRVAQIVGNLVSNARKFAESMVSVSIAAVSPAAQDSAGAPRFARLEVTDDGPGIAAADLPFVFERLYRAESQPAVREAGSGLGLAIVRELAHALGGEVGARSGSSSGDGSVPSGSGQGATIWVTIPLTAAPDPTQPVSATLEAP